jgi:NAD(P)H-dependent FMN reductase
VIGMAVNRRGSLDIAVIVGSTREGRFGPTVAQWFVGQARTRTDIVVDLVDLADVDLPIVFPAHRTAAISSYVDRIGQADGFVVVTPEYNHGYPASLKQAIDLAYHEWRAKPVAFVSYGGMAGGLRAVEQLRQVFAELHATTVRDTVSFHMAHAAFDAAGEPLDAIGPAAAAKTLLDQLAWWAGALRTARATHPYAVAA